MLHQPNSSDRTSVEPTKMNVTSDDDEQNKKRMMIMNEDKDSGEPGSKRMKTSGDEASVVDKTQTAKRSEPMRNDYNDDTEPEDEDNCNKIRCKCDICLKDILEDQLTKHILKEHMSSKDVRIHVCKFERCQDCLKRNDGLIIRSEDQRLMAIESYDSEDSMDDEDLIQILNTDYDSLESQVSFYKNPGHKMHQKIKYHIDSTPNNGLNQCMVNSLKNNSFIPGFKSTALHNVPTPVISLNQKPVVVTLDAGTTPQIIPPKAAMSIQLIKPKVSTSTSSGASIICLSDPVTPASNLTVPHLNPMYQVD